MMNTLESVVAVITIVTSIGGTAIYMDNKHADAKETKSSLTKKADALTVAQLQRTIIIDKISELEEKEFILTRKQHKTDFEEFQLKRAQDRLKTLRHKVK